MKIKNILGLLSAIILFTCLLLDAIALWKDKLPEIKIFNKKFNLMKIFRIEREMLGDHRKPYGVFRICAVSGLLILIGGLVMQNFLKNIGFFISGFSFVVYGSYGMYKKEICDQYGSRAYGAEAIFIAFIHSLIGGGLTACSFLF